MIENKDIKLKPLTQIIYLENLFKTSTIEFPKLKISNVEKTSKSVLKQASYAAWEDLEKLK